MDDIIFLLNLEDQDLEVESVTQEGTTKIVTLFTKPKKRYCPRCGYLMHSRGVKLRTINHPVLQNSFHLELRLKQRRWHCTNESCKYDEAEQFNFVDKNCRNTRATDLLIINEFRELNRSVADIARRFNTSVIKEKYPDMTAEESLALRHWVSEGNSPFKNPDGIGDAFGIETDFINASRILDEAFMNYN